MGILKTAITIIQVIIPILAFGVVVCAARTFHPKEVLIHTYERVNHQLREVNRGLFNYEKTTKFLEANGASFHYGEWINPIKYLFLRMVLGMMCFAGGMCIHPGVALVIMIFGFYGPTLYLVRANQRDNLKMMPQLQSLYNALQEQIKAGVYITDALSECYRGIKKGRLRRALEDLSGEILLKKSFSEAMEHFSAKFNNSTIEALCVILVQAQESGQSVELLSDMAEQLKDMQAAMLIKKKEKLNRVETSCILGILTVIIGIILYACAMTMFYSVNNL